jgi:hypothetical protein
MTCQVTLQRGSVFAIKEETTAGELVVPSAGSDFIPLRSGFAMEYTVEELVSEELLNDEGRAKGASGFENVSGTHTAYAKASEVSGTAPDADLLYKSCLGGKSVAGAEYDTVAASTTTLIKVDTGEGATFEQGEALLIQDAVNGYSIRNIDSISGNDLSINFALANAPGIGVLLGRSVLYKPGSDHTPFSAWLYNGNGGAIQAAAGCRATGLTLNFAAGQQAEVEFTYEGSKYYYNPIIVTTGTNDSFDITDDAVTDANIIIPAGIYNPIELAAAIQTALNAASSEDYTCTYSNSTGKFTIATTTSSLFSILWNTGSLAADSIGPSLGFSVAADDTGALTYTSDNAVSLAAAYTPAYDNATNLVVKDAEFFIGDTTDNLCRCARNLSLQIATPVTNVESICSETGIQEKAILSREVTLTAELIVGKYDVQLFEKLKSNTGVKAMFNLGPKSGGNYVKGKCLNVYLQNATVTQHTLTGDDFLLLNLTLKGYVTSTQKDVFINMI